MNRAITCVAKFGVMLALAGTMANTIFAGKAVKWADVPKAVRTTILANGGKEGQPVDLEPGKKNGNAVYEAAVKDKAGNIADLVVTEDGTLVETKHDDAADRAQELADAAKNTMKFTHPRDITNPYLPLATLKQDVLEGSEGTKRVRITRTAMPEKQKVFKIGDQTIESLVVEDREWEDGELAEVALDYFVQDDAGTVYYLGEDVDEYADGKVVSHEGSWLLGKDTQTPGVILPAHPKVGDKFKSEDVSKDIHEEDEVVSVSEDVIVPAGTYQNCIKVKENLADGSVEYKYYAKGVGVVREVPSVGDVRLKSHKASAAEPAKASKTATPRSGAAQGAISEATAREALKKVGVDPEAEAIWLRAINDPKLNAKARAGLIEDLNEVGFADPAHPTQAEAQMIAKRIDLIKRLRPSALDSANAAALDEALKDLQKMAASSPK